MSLFFSYSLHRLFFFLLLQFHCKLITIFKLFLSINSVLLMLMLLLLLLSPFAVNINDVFIVHIFILFYNFNSSFIFKSYVQTLFFLENLYVGITSLNHHVCWVCRWFCLIEIINFDYRIMKLFCDEYFKSK